MTQDRDVLILSLRTGGGVRAMADLVRSLSLRPVLVSAIAADPHRDACDDHVVVDWDGDGLTEATTRLRAQGIAPIAIINNLEPLIGWQVDLCRHYGLAGAGPGLEVL